MVTQIKAIKFLMRSVSELPHLTKSGKDLLRATVLSKSFRIFGKDESEEISSAFPVCIYTCKKCGRYSFVPFEQIYCECEDDSYIGSIRYKEGMKKEHDDFWERWLWINMKNNLIS